MRMRSFLPEGIRFLHQDPLKACGFAKGWRMAPWVEVPETQQEGLCLEPQHPHERQAYQCVCNTGTGQLRDRQANVRGSLANQAG